MFEFKEIYKVYLKFSDRVVHHIIVSILEQIYEAKFIYHSYSNTKNKEI